MKKKPAYTWKFLLSPLLGSPAIQLLVACSVCTLLLSCGRPTVQVLMSESPPYPDSSVDFSMLAYLGRDTIHFGESRINSTELHFTTRDGKAMKAEIWFPGGTAFDSTNICVLIPGFRDEPLELYPLAIPLTRKGVPALMIWPRGSSINAGVPSDFGIHLAEDASDALSSFQHKYKLGTISSSAFGTSLGAVAVLELVVTDNRIRAGVLESIMPDLAVTAQKILSTSEYNELRGLLAREGHQLEEFNPAAVIQRFPAPKKLLVIWGANDKLISENERAQLQQVFERYAPGSHFERIKNGGHLLRYGFPLSEEETLSLDNRIAAFLTESALH